MKVTVDIISLAVGDTVASAMRASILDSQGKTVATQDIDGVSAAFDGVESGTYTASAQRIDASGVAIGDDLTYQFAALQGDSNRTYYGQDINVGVWQ